MGRLLFVIRIVSCSCSFSLFCVKVLITNEKTNLIKQENPLLIMALLLVVYTCLFLRLVIKPPTCVHYLEVLRKY